MTGFVLDCSVTMTWCFEDEACEYGDRALAEIAAGATPIVPSLWFLEVANVLAAAERRKRLTRRQADAFVDRLGLLPINMYQMDVGVGDALTIARSLNLTAYDAVYVGVALSLGLPLATLDQGIIDVLQSAGAARF